MKNFSALLAGILFGGGLVVAGMTDPLKVLAFLTLGAGWDPTLIFVMGSAVVVTFLGYRLAGTRTAPLFDTQFHTPSSPVIDKRLLGGAAMFGVGWGLAGFCPGPALVGLMALDARAAVFIAACVAGVLLYEKWTGMTAQAAPAAPTQDG